MPRFAANLSTLFTDVPLPDRFERAARAGFSAVEIQFPYAWPAGFLRERLDAHGLRLVLHNLPAGDWPGGERGFACDPGRRAEFAAAVERAIEYARALGAPQLNCLAGIPPRGTSGAEARATFVANLRGAAPLMKAAGLKLLVEPINNRDVPGFWLANTTLAVSVMDEVGADNLFLQYDLYHAQRSEGELAGTLERLLPRIAHIQVADNPGRHEPGSGEIGWDFLFRHLARIGYAGYVGCEYMPAHKTEAGLGWLAAARRQLENL